MTDVALSVRGLSKQFHRGGAAVKAVDNVDFTIRRGETLALAGPSGSGKSTIARMIMRLIDPDTGSIHLQGLELTGLRGKKLRRQRRHFQMVFQDTNSSFNPHASVGQAVVDPLRTFSVCPKQQRTAEAMRLLKRVGLREVHLDQPVHHLSGGQRQRVAIARAIASKPALVVLDEALSAVDVSIRAELIALLLDLQRQENLSYLFISHDLALVRSLAHRVAILDRGQIVEIGDSDAVIASPTSVVGKALLEAVPRLPGERKPG